MGVKQAIRRQRTAPRIGCLLALALVVSLIAASPALADDHLLHTFGTSFTGEGVCRLSQPTRIAVDEAANAVFVYDRAKNQVDGLSLADGSCLAHIKVSASAKGEAENEGIAFDDSGGPSKGSLYVVSPDDHAVLKFKISGSELEQVGPAIGGAGGESIHGIGVDGTGRLYLYEGATVYRFSDGEPNVLETEIALDLGSCQGRRGFAIAADGSTIYAGVERENLLAECEEGTTVIRKLSGAGEPVAQEGGVVGGYLDNTESSGVAVDPESKQAYIDERTAVAAFDSHAGFVQRFGEEVLTSAQGIAVDGQTHSVVVTGQPEASVFVFVPQAAPPPLPPPVPDHVLPDGRAWEMVTPSSKLGATIFGLDVGVTGLVAASEDGSALTFGSSGPIVQAPPSVRGPEATINLARRGPAGWSVQDILTPRQSPPIGYAGTNGDEYRTFTPDLRTATLEPGIAVPLPDEAPLAPEATETTLYVRDLTRTSSECEPTPSSCYRAIVTPANETSNTPFGAQLHLLAATPDAQFVILEGNVPLTSGVPEEAFGQGLYEWSAATGALTFVSTLPAAHEGVEQTETNLGEGFGAGALSGTIQRHALSGDGRRVFWTTGAPGRALYMRDVGLGTTLRLDKPQGVLKTEIPAAVYWDATEDGSRVFFSDTERLLPRATDEAEENAGLGDLYSCDIRVEAGVPKCKLSDLTTTVRGPGESARVQGVIGTSADGNYVYFVADAALEPQAGPGDCIIENAVRGNQCTLYVAHYNSAPGQEAWERPRAIAALRDDEVSSWFGESGLPLLTSRVSPNGRYLAFMSARSLTGYDNEDASHPGERDAEVYLYDAQTATLACPSCDASGAKPQGVFDPPGSMPTSEGAGILMDPQRSWESHWLAGSIPGWSAKAPGFSNYQSRYLSNTGRLFFNASDQLVDADKNHKADVYEYELDHEGSCEDATGCVSLISSGAEADERESAFLDASLSGNDVFIRTSQPLVEADRDTSFDIYDARVCTPADPCRHTPVETPSPCESEATCRAPAGTVAALPPVAPTQTTTGSGNHPTEVDEVPPPPHVVTPLQKLRKALKVCRRSHSKRRRHRCEAKARSRYKAETRAAARRAARRAR